MQSGELRRKGRRVRLQEKPFQLLVALLERPGEVVSKEELQARLWPDVSVDADSGLGEAVYKLRQALGDPAQAPRFVETIQKRGYRFIAAVEGVATEGAPLPDPPPRPIPWRLTGLILACLLLGGVATYIFTLPEPNVAPQRRFSYAVEGLSGAVEISPDGTKLVFAAESALWLQDLSQLWNPRKLPGTEGMGWAKLAWSPDSRRLAFIQEGEIRTLDVSGGTFKSITKAPRLNLAHVVWSPDRDSILLMGDSHVPLSSPLEVSTMGGELRPTERFARLPFYPSFFRSGSGLQAVGVGGPSIYREMITVWSESGSEPRELTPAGLISELSPGGLPRYALSGHVVYSSLMEPAGIWAMPFSAKEGRPTGQPFPVAPGGKLPSISADGALVYAVTAEDYHRLLLLSRDGKALRHIGDRQRFIGYPSFSPDGSRVAVWGFESPTQTDWGVDIWIHEVDRPVKTRLTTHPEVDIFPRWTPDGQSISFSSDRSHKRDIYKSAVDSNRPSELLFASAETPQFLSDWSQDGGRALFSREERPAGDVWVLDAATGEAHAVLTTPFFELEAAFSPDGRYMAFSSDRSGRYEVYVCEIADCAENIRKVSTNGGFQVRWAKQQGSIYYVEGFRKMMEVRVAPAPELKFAEPIERFESAHLGSPSSTRGSFYDVSADGERFVVVDEPRQTSKSPSVIHVWQNWAAAFADGK